VDFGDGRGQAREMAPESERGAPANEDWARTWIGSSTPDSITLAGRDLPSDVMGNLTRTELTYLERPVGMPLWLEVDHRSSGT
jgi:hypothetical protein